MTWKLWQALKLPPKHHHLFRRFYAATEEPFPWYVGCSRYVAILFVFPILAFAGLIYGIGWSVGIANLIGKEKERGAFDLISLSPSGALGVSWAISLGYLYHHITFRNINEPFNLAVRFGIGALCLMALDLLLFIVNYEGSGLGGLTILMMTGLTLLIVLYTDHVQSLVLAPLVGISAAMNASNRLNAQLYAFAGYLGAQLLTYLTMILLGFVMIPALLNLLGIRGELVGILVLSLRVALLYGIREAVIAWLWRRLVSEMTTDPIDIEKIAGRKLSFSSFW